MQKILKRILDIVLSSIAIIVLSPLFLVISILIKLESKGPIIFKQKRIGYKEQEFLMYKFRSMVIDAEEQFEKVKNLNETNTVMFKAQKDPRVTKIGQFIRKYSIDELPQLFNVLKGEMSLVGPRPPLPRELESYKEWHYCRFVTTPGITGLWQTSGRANIQEFDDVVNLDYTYIQNWNIWLDLKLILKTIPVVLLAEGAC